MGQYYAVTLYRGILHVGKIVKYLVFTGNKPESQNDLSNVRYLLFDQHVEFPFTKTYKVLGSFMAYSALH